MKILYGKIMVVMILLTNNISLWGALYRKMYTPSFKNFTQASNFQLPKSPLSQHPEDQSENKNFLDIDYDIDNPTTPTRVYDLIYSPNAQPKEPKPDPAIIKKIKLLIADSPQTVDPSTTSLLLGDIAKPLSRDSNASTQKKGAHLAQKQSKQESIDLSEDFMANNLGADIALEQEDSTILPNRSTQRPLDTSLTKGLEETEESIEQTTVEINEPKTQSQPPQQPTIIIPSKISAGNAATARKEPRTLRAFMQSISDWFSKTFGLSKKKTDADLIHEIVELKMDPSSFVNAPTDQQAAQKYSVWLPQFIQRMLDASKDSRLVPVE